ncbi:hypothetical protein SLA2020_189950 [Shorea laevis]
MKVTCLCDRQIAYLLEVRHLNLVSLKGYCQESGSQILVYEHLPNGSMCNHLYNTSLDSSTRLEFKQRLSITLGAPKDKSRRIRRGKC